LLSIAHPEYSRPDFGRTDFSRRYPEIVGAAAASMPRRGANVHDATRL
jgi:hypothetical protein